MLAHSVSQVRPAAFLAAAALFVAPSLAVPVAPTPQVTQPDLVHALMLGGDTLTLGGTSYEADYFLGLEKGVDGGWVAVAGDLNRTTGRAEGSVIIGRLPGDAAGVVRVLQAPPAGSGVDKPFLISPAMEGGKIAYILASIDGSNVLYGDSLWLDDQRLAQVGDAVSTSSPWTWTAFKSVTMGAGGQLVAEGLATRPGLPQSALMVANVTTGTILFNGRDFFPGLTRRIGSVNGEVSISPDGQHWAAPVILRVTNEVALLVDGHIYELAPGFPVVSGQLLPPQLAPELEDGRWASCHSGVGVDNEGKVTFSGSLALQQSNLMSVTFRNRRLVRSEPGFHAWLVAGVDHDGSITWIDRQEDGEVWTEGHRVMTSVPRVDADGDGTADPDLFFSFYFPRSLRSCEDGVFVGIGEVGLPGPTQDRVHALIETRLSRLGLKVCEGQPNSTGHPGRMLAAGSPLAADNELSLQIWNLPANSRGYVLVSRLSAPPVQPGGSQGTLCLGGAIGRLQSSLYLVGTSGRVSVTLDLGQLPQPTGSVAAMAGETWYAQGWHRDSVAGSATSNFTDAVAVDFR